MNPENEIGWYYRALGFILLCAAVAIPLIKLFHEKEFSGMDVALEVGFLIASLVLIRPDWMDRNFKTILNAIPFVKFTKGSDS